MNKLLRFLLRVCFRFQAFNEAVLSTPGPVLLLPNHLSWIDWLFVGVCLDPDWRFVTSSTTAQTSWVHRLRSGVSPLNASSVIGQITPNTVLTIRNRETTVTLKALPAALPDKRR